MKLLYYYRPVVVKFEVYLHPHLCLQYISWHQCPKRKQELESWTLANSFRDNKANSEIHGLAPSSKAKSIQVLGPSKSGMSKSGSNLQDGLPCEENSSELSPTIVPLKEVTPKPTDPFIRKSEKENNISF